MKKSGPAVPHVFVKIVALLIALSPLYLLHAQTFDRGVITGSIVNGQKKPIAGASVLLKNTKDSAVYKTAISSETGIFSFSQIKEGNFFVDITLVGFDKISIRDILVSSTNTATDLGVISLKDSVQLLGNVTVKSQPPLIERQIDKTVVNVDNSIVSAGTTVLEMIQKLPGVRMTDEGQITLNGKPGVTVFIDGKATYLSDEDLANLLKGMQSSGIQKIEIMTKPPAKYDAAGSGGIINIVKKKNKTEGFNGSVNGSFVQGNYGKYNGGFTLNYKNRFYNLFFNNSYVYNKSLSERTITTDIFNPDNTLNSEQVSATTTVSTYKAWSPSIGADFYLSKKTTLSFSGTAKTTSSGNPMSAWLNLLNGEKIKTDSTAFSNADKARGFNYSTSLHFDHQLDTLGKDFTADADYAEYSNSPSQNIINNMYGTTGNFINQTNTLLSGKRALGIYAVKADYTQPLRGHGRLDAGIKSSYVKSVDNYTFYNNTGGRFIADTSQSDYTITEENINAAYINFYKEYEKLSIQAGLRAEDTWSKGEQVLTSQAIKQGYLQLFPSAFLDYKLNDQNGLNIKIGRRTDRSSYSEMIPLRRALAPTLYFQGNPYLRPQLSVNNELTYSWHNELFITFGYDIYRDYMRTLPYLDSDKVTVTRVPTNIKNSRYFEFDIAWSKKMFPWWSADNSFALYQQAFSGQANGLMLNNNGIPSVELDLNNTFKINPNLSAECSLQYDSKRQLVNSNFGAFYILSFGVKQQLFGGNGTLALNIHNILQSEDHNTVDKYQYLNMYSYYMYNTRAASINFNYRFGKGKISKTHAGTSAEDEKGRAGN